MNRLLVFYPQYFMFTETEVLNKQNRIVRFTLIREVEEISDTDGGVFCDMLDLMEEDLILNRERLVDSLIFESTNIDDINIESILNNISTNIRVNQPNWNEILKNYLLEEEIHEQHSLMLLNNYRLGQIQLTILENNFLFNNGLYRNALHNYTNLFNITRNLLNNNYQMFNAMAVVEETSYFSWISGLFITFGGIWLLFKVVNRGLVVVNNEPSVVNNLEFLQNQLILQNQMINNRNNNVVVMSGVVGGLMFVLNKLFFRR